jgi:hypothetical protein
MVSFSKNLDNIPSDIKERYRKLFIDPKYIDYVRNATTDVETLKNRLQFAEKILFG